MISDNDGLKVTYTIKELLQDIRLSVERLDTKLDTKADQSEVDQIKRRVDAQDKLLDQLAYNQTTMETTLAAARDTRRFRIPLILSAAFNIVSPFLWWGVNHLH